MINLKYLPPFFTLNLHMPYSNFPIFKFTPDNPVKIIPLDHNAFLEPKHHLWLIFRLRHYSNDTSPL